MATATFVKDLTNFRGEARLYRLTPPLEAERWNVDTETDETQAMEFVAVSAVVAYSSGPETYIFEADSDGNVLAWGELSGSFRGDLDHEQALRNAGYEVV